MRKLLFLSISLFVALTMATARDVNLDSLYGSYMTDKERAIIDKFNQLEQRLAEEKRERQLKWTIIFSVCALTSLTTTVYIFKEVFKHRTPDTPLSRTILSGIICLGGGIAIFLTNLVWFYFSFEADNFTRHLFFFALLIALGIALWIYTKNLKKENPDGI